MDRDPDAGSAGNNETKSAPDRGPPVQRDERLATVDERKAEVRKLIMAMRLRGNTSLKGIADELNRRGIPAIRGGQWTSIQVSRLL